MSAVATRSGRSYVDRMQERIRSPFTRFLVFLSNTQAWVEETPTRSKWALRIFWISIALEIEIHIKGIRHWAEASHWWEAFPLLGYLKEYLFQ